MSENTNEILSAEKIVKIKNDISLVESIRIIYPRIAEVIEDFEITRVDGKYSIEAQCMFLMGEPGTGKSTLIKMYAKRFPPEYTDNGDVIRVFTAEIPPKATIKGVARNLLAGLHAPRPGKGDTMEMTERLIELLRNCKVELIILDEFQHLLQRSVKRNFEEIGDWIKSLINATRIPIVLVGMPESKALLSANSQLARRFGILRTLKPFDYSVDSEEYRKFLRAVYKQLPFAPTSRGVKLYDPLVSARIFLASKGNPSSTMRLIR